MAALIRWARKRWRLFLCGMWKGTCPKCAPYKDDPAIREF